MNDLHEKLLFKLNNEFVPLGECVNLCKRIACSERLRISYHKYPGIRLKVYELNAGTI